MHMKGFTKFLAQMGMPASLRARKWATPPESMYQLSREEVAAMATRTAFVPVLHPACRNPNDAWPASELPITSNDLRRSVCYRKTLVNVMRLGGARYLGRLRS